MSFGNNIPTRFKGLEPEQNPFEHDQGPPCIGVHRWRTMGRLYPGIHVCENCVRIYDLDDVKLPGVIVNDKADYMEARRGLRNLSLIKES